ncbi:hypothetical protein [Actinomadura parmotrematis]|uniref:Uncharacterized protein n=1 Tax=Actinomadura parmotrematis TaxID=2864039 RepID=A0ABS7FYL7_9ACTN|nr:hypothetical protein [Actinomadura parmotrematis]MBW8484749.1 hypothetical protein [Actinomadura parmotrematis]
MQRKLPDISTTQLIASGLATGAAAVGASYLGVYGTIAGAALMSVMSTAGTAIGKHYLDQGKEQLRERTALHSAAAHRQSAGEAAADAVSADPTRAVVWSGVMDADPNATRLDRPVAAPGPPSGDPNATRLDRPHPGAFGDPNATRLDAGAGAGAGIARPDAGRAEAAVAGEIAGDAGEDAVRHAAWKSALTATLAWARQRWVTLVVASVAMFAVVMGAITVAEKITNKPAASWVGQSGGKGTTWSNLGGSTGSDPTPTPTVRPSGSGTGSPAPSESGTGGSGRQSTAPSQAPAPPTSGGATAPSSSSGPAGPSSSAPEQGGGGDQQATNDAQQQDQQAQQSGAPQ